jgi:uncharacterized protein (TIGR03118 family)
MTVSCWIRIIVPVTLGAACAFSSIPATLQAAETTYQRHNLVSDGAVPADHVDSHVVNAWGIVFNPNGPVWIANNGTSTSTLYDGAGNPAPLVVTIPGGSPTGIVFSGSSDFKVPKGDPQGNPSRFLFATEQGTIAAWAPPPSPPLPTAAVTVVDNSGMQAIYKGLALAANGTGHFLYATDFHNGKIDVFDTTFQLVELAGDFIEPSVPLGFAPFGIQNINGDLYVTYAKQDADKEDDVHGKGLGFVSVFDSNGHFLRRFASRGALNAPWGLTLAPASFGKFAGRLLIGNFGDGTIGAYDLATGEMRGRLRQADGKPLTIDGLWGLSFGSGVLNQSVDALFFTAGPQDEAHGLYGRIDPVPEPH